MKNGFQKLTAIFMTVLMFLAVIPVSAWGAEQYSNSVVPGISVLSILPGDTNTITYIFQKKNGEQTEEISRQIVKKGDTLLEPEVKTGENEKFTGWDPAVTFGTVGKITETKTITVTAKIEKVYYIFFKDNTGRVVATKECTDGQTVSDFSDVTFPVGSDESITGWYFDEAAQTEKADSVTINGQNVTLYAKVEKGYWITFDANGGSYTAPVFYANGTVAAAPVTKPTLPGYSFDRWYLDKECKNEADFSKITTSTTVYAGWKAADTTYTVIHWQENADDNGYSYAESDKDQPGASGAQTAARAKSYLGFTAQAIEQKTIAGDGSTIVNVYYKRNIYSVKFYSRGNSEYKDLRITAKYGANISDKWPTYNGSSTWAITDGGSTYQVNIDTMPFNGATFYGPKTGSDSETAYYYVEVLPGESGTVYNRVTYKLHHKDTSPGTGYSISDEDMYPITGFTFKEFDAKYGYNFWGQIYYNYDNAKFYYTRNSYNVVYVSNGQTVNTASYKYEADISKAGDYVPTTKPVGKEDYVFDTWYADPTGQTEYKFDGKTMPAQNITVYAKWVPPTYTVTFYDHDGNQVDALTIAKGAKLDESQVPTITLDEGETFLGWKLQDGTPFNLDTEINRNYELYAHVGSTKGYRVQYEGGKDTTGTAPLDDTNYAEGSYADVKLPGDLAKADKVFLGWALKEDAQKADYQPGDKLPIDASMAANGIITLYAVWGPKPATTTLTYDANYDGANPKTKLHELEDGTTILPNNAQIKLYGADTFTRPGYELIGWNVDQNAEKPTYQPGDEVIVDNLGENGNVLYAVWKRSVITLTVTKEVTGNFGDKTKLFVIIAKANGANIKRFSLKDKASDAMENFVIGTALTLTEMNPGQGYKVSAVYSYVDENGQTVSTPAMASQDGDDWNLTFGADTLVQNGTITITNEKNTTPDTGVLVDSLPYILIIACVAGVAALFLIRRRKKRED